jgi:flagellar L-ring protein precursor FlgH
MRLLVGAVLLMVSAGHAAGQTPVRQKPVKPSDSYDELYARYLTQARAAAQPVPPDPWSWMNGLAVDSRARHVNDLVSIRVEESITASGAADSSLSKKTDTSNSVTGLFGLTSKLPSVIDPLSLANAKNQNGFKGSGATTRSGVLTTLLTARVADVLPNGDLVVEGVREIDINGDLQIVVLTGVVRVVDLAPGNVVSSTSVGQLRIQYFGRGLMKDSLSPGWLLRVLNKIF